LEFTVITKKNLIMERKSNRDHSPEIIDLSSSADEDENEDEDLQRAIALSLGNDYPPPKHVRKHQKEKSKSQEPINSVPADSSTEPVKSHMTTFGSLLLDRKRMEQERQERLRKKRQQESPPPETSRPAQRPKISGASLSKNKHLETTSKDAITATSKTHHAESSTQTLPFAKGAVKRTWTQGCERRGDDIKIEEVFQKNELKLAVLASFQWDDDWLLSKIDLSRTKLICIAFARDEAHVRHYSSNFYWPYPGSIDIHSRKTRCGQMCPRVISGFASQPCMVAVQCTPKSSY